MAAGIGRPRGSTLWDYFEYEDENKSVCTVTTTEGLQCLIKIAEKFPTNLRKHLGKCHSEAFKESEKKEEKNTGSAKVRISHLLPFIIMCKWEIVYLFYTNSLAILDLYKYSLFLVYVHIRLLLC